jgi:hypothetical protein
MVILEEPIKMSTYCISDVMVSILNSSAIDRWFEHQSDQTKDFEIGICCFSSKTPSTKE